VVQRTLGLTSLMPSTIRSRMVLCHSNRPLAAKVLRSVLSGSYTVPRAHAQCLYNLCHVHNN
jgi:hypothetical protein